MNKAGSNTKWQGLTAKQLAQLEAWLFGERITYAEALERARNEFGFAGSVSSLKRFYQRRKKERVFEDFDRSLKDAEMVEDAPNDTDSMESAGMKMVGRLFLKRVMEAPDAVKEWEPLARLLLAGQKLDVKRQWKKEDHRIRFERLELAMMKYNRRAEEYAINAVPELKELLQEMKEDEDTYKFNKWSNAVRTQLFGEGNFWDVLPENAKEERRMEKEKEARRKAEEQGKVPKSVYPDLWTDTALKPAEPKAEQAEKPPEAKKKDAS